METIYKRCAIILAGLLAAGLAACSDSETQEPAPVAVTGVKLDRTEPLMLEIGDRTTLMAAVLPADAANRNVSWRSSDDRVATVEEGIVTALATGRATIIVTTEEGGHEASCEIAVAHPELGFVSFRTPTEWRTGDLTWSDVVLVSAARDKTEFDGGTAEHYRADFRDNDGEGDLFSWRP